MSKDVNKKIIENVSEKKVNRIDDIAQRVKSSKNHKSSRNIKINYRKLSICLVVLFATLAFIFLILFLLRDALGGFSTLVPSFETLKFMNYEEQPLTNFAIYKQTPKVKGVYLSEYTVSSDTQVDKWIDICKRKEINAVVINVKNDDGLISFKMDYDTANEIGADRNTIKDPAGLVLKLKQAGIFPIARIVTFKDPYLASNRPDLALKDNSGNVLRVKSGNNYEAWVNPYNKEVWEYIVEIGKRAADVGFSEIQFDYIRFATGPQMSEANFGPSANTLTKRDIILDFSRYAKEELSNYGVYVSADVFGTIITSDLDASIVGQNYLEMAKIYDYICPMIYPSHYSNGSFGVQYPDLEPYAIISGALKASNNLIDQIPEGEHRAIVRAWLQDFTATWVSPHKTYGATELINQKEAVYAQNLNEWLLWNAGNKYTIDGLANE